MHLKYSFILILIFFLGKLLQSRILKHSGDFTAAAALADEARCMDLADRYINSECVKRMLQADQVLKWSFSSLLLLSNAFLSVAFKCVGCASCCIFSFAGSFS